MDNINVAVVEAFRAIEQDVFEIGDTLRKWYISEPSFAKLKEHLAALKQSLAQPQSQNISKTDSLRAEWGLRTLDPEVQPNLQPQAPVESVDQCAADGVWYCQHPKCSCKSIPASAPVVPEECGYCAKGVCYKHGEDAATEPSQRDELAEFQKWSAKATFEDLASPWTVWRACAASKGKS